MTPHIINALRGQVFTAEEVGDMLCVILPAMAPDEFRKLDKLFNNRNRRLRAKREKA